MSELRECPFCGGEAEVVRCGTPRQSSQISCTNCNCHLESSGRGLRSGDAWNTRAKPRLPRVSPEGMVDGQWYIYNYHKSTVPMIGRYVDGKMFNAHDEYADCWVNEEYVEVWGPVEIVKEGEWDG